MSGNLPILEDACHKLNHTTRAMFGGHGLFAPNGGMFAAIVDDDRIILKFSDAAARADLEALGGAAWIYPGRGKPMVMKEWILIPDAFYDDQEVMMQWTRKAWELVPAKARKPARGAKPAAATKPRAATVRAKPSRRRST